MTRVDHLDHKGGSRMMKERISRRDFLRLSSGLTAGALMVACSPVAPGAAPEAPAAQPASAAAKSVSIQTGWFAQEEPGRDFWQRVIAAFSEKSENADLAVELVNVGTTPEDMLSSIAGGTAPDVYHTYGGTTGSFDVEDLAPRGVALPLDDFIAAATYFQKDDYYPEQWESKTWDGKVWGLPVTEGGPGGFAMSWHKRYFEAAGFDPERGPQNWDQVADYALQLSTYDDAGTLDVQGFDPLDATGCCWPGWAMWFNAPGISEDKRTILFDQGNWGLFMEFIKEVYQGIGVEQMAAHKLAWGYWTGHTSGFPNGKRAMLLNGYWQPGEFESVLADQSWEIGYDWPLSIDGEKVMTFGGTHTLWMTANTEQPEEAFRFMDFIMSVEANLINFNLRGGFVLSKPLEEVLDTTRYKGLDFFMAMRENADRIYSPQSSSSPIGAQMNELWNRAVQEVIYDQKMPEAALRDITAELQQALDLAWESREASLGTPFDATCDCPERA
jgi:ABC-type glycerol-3-phosphate transport system substrate-binding protein